jgi:predicted RNase H-like nuclease (RuvC/YqgF family)
MSVDPLQRAMKAAEQARSHAYNADTVLQQMRRRIEKLEADVRNLQELLRYQARQVANLQASLDAAMRSVEEE